MATEADLIQKFKDLNIPVGADFEELIHAAFASSNLADRINSKADDSKVVHTADMRKPANQVASIDEVNAKQDKIGYTPADDSKVVHTTDTSNWQKQKVTADNGLPSIFVRAGSKISDSLKAINQAGFWSLYASGGASDNPWGDAIKGFTVCDSTDGHWSATVGTLEASGNYVSIVNENGTIRFNKGSDDSKVAHLSGANSFDTVPTVNNNPLLLASSLPSDLARTSQQTNFTAGLKSGGVDVATAADIKSIEDASWHELDLSGTSGIYKGKINIKIDDANKTIYLDGAMYFPDGTSPSPGTGLIDLSKVVNSITGSYGYLFFIYGNNEHATMTGEGLGDYTASTVGFTGSTIKVNNDIHFYFGNANYILPFPAAGKSNIYITYDELV